MVDSKEGPDRIEPEEYPAEQENVRSKMLADYFKQIKQISKYQLTNGIKTEIVQENSPDLEEVRIWEHALGYLFEWDLNVHSCVFDDDFQLVGSALKDLDVLKHDEKKRRKIYDKVLKLMENHQKGLTTSVK